ncbi:hypothetical protein D3C71_1721310 [compost metagenome]
MDHFNGAGVAIGQHQKHRRRSCFRIYPAGTTALQRHKRNQSSIQVIGHTGHFQQVFLRLKTHHTTSAITLLPSINNGLCQSRRTLRSQLSSYGQQAR